jgi:chorismate lyase/3-hydroxybenzoate synthase
MTTSAIAAHTNPPKPSLNPLGPRISYLHLAAGDALPSDALFAVTFGAHPPIVSPRVVRLNLQPLAGAGLTEVWHATGNVVCGVQGAIRHTADDHFLSAVIEVDEREHGGMLAAATFAYRTIARFQAHSRFPHLLRTWNYFDAINRGVGDSERYREFCSGRVAGLDGMVQVHHPAATVIGRSDGDPTLQVYWLAGRHAGIALENPRQLSAYHYPHQYGPTSPTFSRAMLVAPDTLMISGTASIVGHASQHAESAAAQVDEILVNLVRLLQSANALAPALPTGFSTGSLIKAYIRNRRDLPMVDDKLRRTLPDGTRYMILEGEVCRSELLVEFDCVHTAVRPAG